MTSVDDKLELLSLSNEEFADGLARLVKAFTSKDSKEDKLFKPSTSTDSSNSLLLENNTPIVTGG